MAIEIPSERTLCKSCKRQTRTMNGHCVECWALKDPAAVVRPDPLLAPRRPPPFPSAETVVYRIVMAAVIAGAAVLAVFLLGPTNVVVLVAAVAALVVWLALIFLFGSSPF